MLRDCLEAVGGFEAALLTYVDAPTQYQGVFSPPSWSRETSSSSHIHAQTPEIFQAKQGPS